MLLQTFRSCHVKMALMLQKTSILFEISRFNFFRTPGMPLLRCNFAVKVPGTQLLSQCMYIVIAIGCMIQLPGVTRSAALEKSIRTKKIHFTCLIISVL